LSPVSAREYAFRAEFGGGSVRISFFTLGSRGDIEPLAWLAKGFADAGHDVTFISDESAKPLLAPMGVPAHYLAGNLRERWAPGSALPFRQRLNPFAMARALTEPYADVIGSWIVQAAEAALRSNLLIFSNASYGIGYAIAQRVRAIPCEASVFPARSSRYLPSALLPWPGLPVAGGIGFLLHEATVRAGWLGAREVVNAGRRALGLEAVSWPFGRTQAAFREALPVLYGYSPTLLPPPPDWPKTIAVTGSWHRRSPVAWQPPQALASFLAAGPTPVYVGFGSMLDPRPDQVRDIVLRSLRRLGLRAVVARGWGAVSAASSSDDIFVVDEVPHDWLFPRMAAVVCHGGSGTVGAALRAGTVPVVVPYFSDQPFWGWALERKGVAPRMVPRWRLSAGRLTAALRRATTDAAMRARMSEVSQQVQAENGVWRAVEVIEGWLLPARVGPNAARDSARTAAEKLV
jgi:sterol 3beta-glucosyltransferase